MTEIPDTHGLEAHDDAERPDAHGLEADARTPYAHELEAYDDIELDIYLQANGRTITVRDPKNFTEQFIQRLKARARPIGSAAVDLDQVTARLMGHVARMESPSRGRSPSPPSSPEDNSKEEYLEMLAYERKGYEELLADGGRPWYPIHFLETVSTNPVEHKELLHCWQGDTYYGQNAWEVFEPQLLRWRDFRAWQLKMLLHTTGQFDKDPAKQDKLTTWLEYVSYEHMLYRTFDLHKRRKPWYDRAWKEVVDSGVLRPGETDRWISSYHHPDQHKKEEVQHKEAVKHARDALLLAEQAIPDPGQSPSSYHQRVTAARSGLDEATQALQALERRGEVTFKFKVATTQYCQVRRSKERRDILIKWIGDQIPLIERELKPPDGAAGGPEPGPDNAPTPSRDTTVDDEAAAQHVQRSRAQSPLDAHSPARREVTPSEIPPGTLADGNRCDEAAEQEPPRHGSSEHDGAVAGEQEIPAGEASSSRGSKRPRGSADLGAAASAEDNDEDDDVEPEPRPPRRSARIAARPSASAPVSVAGDAARRSRPRPRRAKTASPKRRKTGDGVA